MLLVPYSVADPSVSFVVVVLRAFLSPISSAVSLALNTPNPSQLTEVLGIIQKHLACASSVIVYLPLILVRESNFFVSIFSDMQASAAFPKASLTPWTLKSLWLVFTSLTASWFSVS